jgi:hypothetical protein
MLLAIGYAVLCVVVPALWGLIVYWASNAVEKRVRRSARRKPGAEHEDDVPSVEYYI